MAKNLHPKIQALRDSVGHLPFQEFYATRKKKFEPLSKGYRTPSFSPDNPRLVKQYFAVWGVPDDHGTRPVKGFFAKSIQERGPKTDATNKILVLNCHNQRDPVCVPSLLQEDDIGLYGEYEPDAGIQSNDELLIRIQKRTINNGSYGFNYMWDKMEYNEKDDVIDMYEGEVFEVSPCAFGSQGETFVVRNSRSLDPTLEEETQKLIKKIPREHQLAVRSLIARHISLAQFQPDEQREKPLKKRSKPKQPAIDFDYIMDNLKF